MSQSRSIALGILVGMVLVFAGCPGLTASRRTSSRSAYGRPVSLVGARSPDKFAVRVALEGEGAAVAPEETADAGFGGREAPRGYVGGTVGLQFGKYFEWGLIGGVFLGQSRSHGNPVPLDDMALALVATELRTIFGPEDWQISIHLRLGQSAAAATWDFQDKRVDDDGGRVTDAGVRTGWALGFTAAAGLSVSWRITDYLSLFGGINVDFVPYLSRESAITFACEGGSGSDNCSDGTGKDFPPFRYGAVPVGFLGIEASLHKHVRARVTVIPALLQPDGSTPAWFATNAALEFVY